MPLTFLLRLFHKQPLVKCSKDLDAPLTVNVLSRLCRKLVLCWFAIYSIYYYLCMSIASWWLVRRHCICYFLKAVNLFNVWLTRFTYYAICLFFVNPLFFLTVSDVNFRGPESRRNIKGLKMLHSGNYYHLQDSKIWCWFAPPVCFPWDPSDGYPKSILLFKELLGFFVRLSILHHIIYIILLIMLLT